MLGESIFMKWSISYCRLLTSARGITVALPALKESFDTVRTVVLQKSSASSCSFHNLYVRRKHHKKQVVRVTHVSMVCGLALRCLVVVVSFEFFVSFLPDLK